MEESNANPNPCSGQESSSNGEGSALIFLGTGPAGTVPNVMCLLRPSDPPCKVCSQALTSPPELNPNYRCNTSLLIDYCPEDGGDHRYVIIDVGKTFREVVLRWFVRHRIPRVDSVILTHEHADAVLGLDDIRMVQPFSATNDIEPMPIYLTQHTMDSLSLKFPYLVRRKLKPGQEVRRVSQLGWNIIDADTQKPFIASGLQFSPLPVMHGEDYLCLGFLFGQRSRVAYISDVSSFLPETEYAISKDGGGQLDLLILNSISKAHSHNSHFVFSKSLEAIKRVFPKRALLIGMIHDFDHHVDNEFLADWSRREGISVQLAHDGLRVPIDL